MESILRDLRFALRMLTKSPVVTLAAVVVLAFGISANLVNFALADAYLLRKPHFAEPDRLVHVWETDRRAGHNRVRASLQNFLDWKSQNTVFEDMAAFNYTGETLISPEGPERVTAARVSANAFELLGVKPLLGRAFQSGEDAPGAADVVVLSHKFWKSRYNSDHAVLGKTLNINGRLHTIIGVMPADFAFPLTITQFWIPRQLNPAENSREQRFLQVAARLKPGVSSQQAQAEMNTIAERLAREYPQSNKDSGANLQPLAAALNFADDVLRIVTAVLGVAAVLLLLVVAANVASLLTARAVGRSREIAIRAALGAGRARILRQLLTESVLLALVGGALGVLLANWSLRGIAQAIPEDIYRVGELSVSGAGLAVCAALCLLTALVFGLAPALQLSRTNVVDALKGGPVASGGRRLFGGLTIAQVGLSVILLAACGIIAQTLIKLQDADLGFRPQQVLTMNLTLPRAQYKTPEQRAAFHQRWTEEARSVPGVVSAATVSFLPLNHETDPVEVLPAGAAPDSDARQRLASQLSITADFFNVMQIPLKAGRAFDSRDTSGAQAVVIINDALAQSYFPGGAVGQSLALRESNATTNLLVVGVVGNIRYSDELEGSYAFQIYRPQAQAPDGYHYLVARTALPPASASAGIRGALARIDATLPVTNVRMMEEVVAESLLPRSMMAASLGVFGIGALVLAALSLYGLLSHWVAQRTREIGVRMALGARPADILRLVIKQGSTLVAIGAALGMAASIGVARILGSFLLGAAALQPAVMILVAVMLAGVALLACYLPARRAARVDPMVALRYE